MREVFGGSVLTEIGQLVSATEACVKMFDQESPSSLMNRGLDGRSDFGLDDTEAPMLAGYGGQPLTDANRTSDFGTPEPSIPHRTDSKSGGSPRVSKANNGAIPDSYGPAGARGILKAIAIWKAAQRAGVIIDANDLLCIHLSHFIRNILRN